LDLGHASPSGCDTYLLTLTHPRTGVGGVFPRVATYPTLSPES
jgi:hypothetical protein